MHMYRSQNKMEFKFDYTSKDEVTNVHGLGIRKLATPFHSEKSRRVRISTIAVSEDPYRFSKLLGEWTGFI